MNAIDRLLLLKQANREVGARMDGMRERFLQIKNRHELGTAPRPVIGFNLFQTPRPIAAMMAERLADRLGDGARVLEPSAGLGRLVEPFVRDAESLRLRWELVEEVGECCRALNDMLRRMGTVRNADFLAQTADGLGGKFDAVVMNPPFKRGTDIRHIEHALGMLRDGGRLVTLCYNGPRQREKIKPIAAEWIELPARSFREEGTDADVAMAVIDV